MSEQGIHYSPEQFTAILLCGGKGTRLESLTDGILPKSLVKVHGRELLRYSIEPVILDHRINKIVFAVGHLAGQVCDWVRSLGLSIEISFSEQFTPGVIGAIHAAVIDSPAETFLICNTDEVRDGVDVSSTVDHHLSHSLPATLLASYSNNLFRHRLLQINESGHIIGSQLKAPQYHDDNEAYGYINTGMMCVDMAAFEYVDTSTHGNDWSALINPLHDHGLLAAHVQDRVRYFNVGTPVEYEEAEMVLSEKQVT